jgi:hypothetical protein
VEQKLVERKKVEVGDRFFMGGGKAGLEKVRFAQS